MDTGNVGTPRFYIDYGQYWQAIGQFSVAGAFGSFGATTEQWENLAHLNPSNIQTFPISGQQDWGVSLWYTPWTSASQMDINYCAWLGHNCASAGASLGVSTYSVATGYVNVSASEIANFAVGGNLEALDGFSLVEFTGGESGYEAFRPYVHPTYDSGWQSSFLTDLQFGALSFGRYYEMPHSPDLSLTMSHEYDGIKTVETKGGTTLSDMRYHKVPMWGDLEAWQLGGWNRLSSGRRVWDLSFSYVSDLDIEPYNYYGVVYEADTGSPLAYEGTDNWFTNVLYYTNGGQLPFIFQPDKDATYDDSTYTVPEFAICRFDMSTFKRKQVANSVYNIKVKIVESW